MKVLYSLIIVVLLVAAAVVVAVILTGNHYKAKISVLEATTTTDTIYIDSVHTVVKVDSTALKHALARYSWMKMKFQEVMGKIPDTVWTTNPEYVNLLQEYIDSLEVSKFDPCAKSFTFDTLHTIANWHLRIHGEVNCYKDNVLLRIGKSYKERKCRQKRFGAGVTCGYFDKHAIIGLNLRYKSFSVMPLYNDKQFGGLVGYTFNF